MGPGILWDTVDKQAVRILLKCLLVSNAFIRGNFVWKLEILQAVKGDSLHSNLFHFIFISIVISTKDASVNPGLPKFVGSPNWPRNYQNNENRTWTVRAPPGNILNVTLLFFMPEIICHDKLYIYEGTLNCIAIVKVPDGNILAQHFLHFDLIFNG